MKTIGTFARLEIRSQILHVKNIFENTSLKFYVEKSKKNYLLIKIFYFKKRSPKLILWTRRIQFSEHQSKSERLCEL